MKRNFCTIQDFEDDDATEENDDEEVHYQIKRSAFLFLIDGRKSMFLSNFDGEKSAFVTCLECVKNSMRRRIFNEEKCFCGVILLGTNTSENALKLDNITVVQELSLLGSKHILKVNEILQEIESGTYSTKYGHDNFSLGDALWLSTHTFHDKSQKTNKNIFFFTNDDDGVVSGKNDFKRALASMQDMYNNFIFFDVIQLGKEFNMDKFYNKLTAGLNFSFPKPVTNLEEMERRTCNINYRHVNFLKLPFVISKDFQIGVSVHFIVRKSKLPFKVKLSKATNEKVETRMQLFETETGSVVSEKNIVKSQVIGLKEISFKMCELRRMADINNVELKLMGFKPASTISLENFVRPCAFIYPDETIYKGSSTFFVALLKSCIKKQVVPICTLCMRKTSTSRFVALIAQNEDGLIINNRNFPQGFIVFFLPFTEEIRPVDSIQTQRAEPEQVDIAKRLIKKLKFKYRAECFQNPRLKTHWAAVEALALELNESEKVNDCTYPNFELMSQRSGEIAKEFMEAVYDEHYDPELMERAKKPRAPPKKDTSMSNEEVEKLIREGKGILIKNDTLKSYLASVGKGKNLFKVKKSLLIEKIERHLNLN